MSSGGPISFRSSVCADEMTFHEISDARVTFHGDAGAESRSGTERTGLPDAVATGTTYREVRVDFVVEVEIDRDVGV